MLAHNHTFPQLSEEDMMSIYKLEMSFENSFASIPLMGAETNEIWDFISQSWNFRKVSHSFTSSLLTEAVELCLRRNLIFLQENSDFASLSIKDRKVGIKHILLNIRQEINSPGVIQQQHGFDVPCTRGDAAHHQARLLGESPQLWK